MSTILKIQPLGFPWETQDPFLFCAHHLDHYPKGNEHLGPDPSLLDGRNIGQDFTVKDGWRMYHGDTIPGFPSHPHRGFETITIATKGLIDHADSLGSAGRFGNGDVQWMTAGKGVQHSEMFPLLKQDGDNPAELFQIWLNLPQRSKMVEPHYKMIWSEDMPVLEETDATGRTTSVRVIAGTLKGLIPPTPTPDSWAADPENEVAVWTIRIAAGGQWTIPGAKNHVPRTLYFYEGDTLEVQDETIDAYHSIGVVSTEDLTIKAGTKDAYILLLQGKPINEPVAQYGPFVMNTQREIMETFEDYQKTQFGGWPWPRTDMVHGKEPKRFALHADGTEEKRS